MKRTSASSNQRAPFESAEAEFTRAESSGATFVDGEEFTLQLYRGEHPPLQQKTRLAPKDNFGASHGSLISHGGFVP